MTRWAKPSVQFRMDKQILQSRRSAKEARGPVGAGPQQIGAKIDFGRDSGGAGGPKRCAGMGVGMVRNPVAAAQDFREKMRIFLRALPNHKKRGAGLKAIEQIQHRDGVGGRGAVINREPDFGFRGLEGTHDRTPPLAIGHERRVKQQDMGEKDRSEREDDICPRKIKSQTRR